MCLAPSDPRIFLKKRTLTSRAPPFLPRLSGFPTMALSTPTASKLLATCSRYTREPQKSKGCKVLAKCQKVPKAGHTEPQPQPHFFRKGLCWRQTRGASYPKLSLSTTVQILRPDSTRLQTHSYPKSFRHTTLILCNSEA